MRAGCGRLIPTQLRLVNTALLWHEWLIFYFIYWRLYLRLQARVSRGEGCTSLLCSARHYGACQLHRTVYSACSCHWNGQWTCVRVYVRVRVIAQLFSACAVIALFRVPDRQATGNCKWLGAAIHSGVSMLR